MLCGSLTSSLASARRDLKCVYRQVSSGFEHPRKIKVYLEIASEIVHVAPILVVVARITPNEADFLLEGVPCLEIGYSSWGFSAMLSTYSLLHALERYWVSDVFVVVF